MTPDDLILRKQKLDNDIYKHLLGLTNDFRAETGFSVRDIDVNFGEVTHIGASPDHVLIKASASVSLD